MHLHSPSSEVRVYWTYARDQDPRHTNLGDARPNDQPWRALTVRGHSTDFRRASLGAARPIDRIAPCTFRARALALARYTGRVRALKTRGARQLWCCACTQDPRRALAVRVRSSFDCANEKLPMYVHHGKTPPMSVQPPECFEFSRQPPPIFSNFFQRQLCASKVGGLKDKTPAF